MTLADLKAKRPVSPLRERLWRLTTNGSIFYMTHRRKGKNQAAAAAKAGISVRFERRIEKGQRSPVGYRH